MSAICLSREQLPGVTLLLLLPLPGDVDGAHDEAYSEDDKDDDYADHANDGVKLRHEFWVDQSIS